MKDIKIKLYEIFSLSAELSGTKKPDGSVETTGILGLKLPVVLKYWLTELSETVEAEKKKLLTQRDDLIKALGQEKEDGSFSLETFEPLAEGAAEGTERTLNPKFTEFTEKYNALLQEEKELKYSPVKLSLFERVESDLNFPTIFKFVDKAS